MRDNQPINPVAAVPAESAAAQPAAQSPQERLREITAGIEQGIQNLFQSERYAQYFNEIRRNNSKQSQYNVKFTENENNMKKIPFRNY